jgi:hypothetical protein
MRPLAVIVGSGALGLGFAVERLAPEKRLTSGCEYIQGAGIAPDRYSRSTAAAEAILARSSAGQERPESSETAVRSLPTTTLREA